APPQQRRVDRRIESLALPPTPQPLPDYARSHRVLAGPSQRAATTRRVSCRPSRWPHKRRSGARHCCQRSYRNLLIRAGALFPRKAYSRVLFVRTTSEHVVLETKRLPLLETLLINIEGWPVELVKREACLTLMYADFLVRKSAATAA